MEHGAGPAWALALEHSALAQAIRESVWIYPSLNLAHVLAMAMLVGAIWVFDLKVLGLGRGIDIRSLTRLALPLAATGITVALPTGFMLFIAEATAYIQNPVFLAKLGFIGAGLINVASAHLGPYRRLVVWTATAPPRAARFNALLSLSLWLGAAASGRLIAYY
jgi:hypothetical protein